MEARGNMVEVRPAVPQFKVEAVVDGMLELFNLERVKSPMGGRDKVASSKMSILLTRAQFIRATKYRKIGSIVLLWRKPRSKPCNEFLQEARRFPIRHEVIDLRHASVLRLNNQ